MKRFPLFLVVLFGGFLLIGADGCSSDPNVEGAKLDLRNKDYDRALENVTKALESNPENAEAHELKGQILQEQAFAVPDVDQHTAMLQEMMEAYNRSAEIDPARNSSVENQLKLAYYNEFQRGIQAFNRGQQADDGKMEFNNAATYFGNAATIFPDSIGAYINQAFAYFSSGESARAIEPFEMAIEKGDTSKDSFTYLASLYQQENRIEDAIDLLKKAREHYMDEEGADIQTQLMNLYVVAGREGEAAGEYRAAIESEPDNKLYRYNYGSLLLQMEDYDGAIEHLEKAVEIDPDYANAHYNLGAAYVNKAVILNDEITTLDDELREKRSDMSDEQIKQMESKMLSLADQRRDLFGNAVTPLERAKDLSEAEEAQADALAGICQALFQAYVQTDQTDKAESISDCAGYDLN